MSQLSVVLVTAPSMEVAANLARALVEESLAACVNLVPQVRSIYRWEGRVCDEPEVLLMIKTRSSRFEAVAARVRALHPYEVPEVLELPAGQVEATWREWCAGNVSGWLSVSSRAPARFEDRSTCLQAFGRHALVGLAADALGARHQLCRGRPRPSSGRLRWSRSGQRCSARPERRDLRLPPRGCGGAGGVGRAFGRRALHRRRGRRGP